MIYTIIAIFVLLVIILNQLNRKGIKQITTEELKQKLKKSDIQLIDVRTKGEFQANKIKEAKNIPLNELNSRWNELVSDREVFLICQSGMRSNRAASILKRKGFQAIVNVQGGMSSWKHSQ